MPVNRRSPRPPNSTQIAGSRHRHRRQMWDYGQSACTPASSARQWTHVSPHCVVRLRAFGRCQAVPSTPVGRFAMRNAVRSTNLVTGAAPRAGSRVPPGRRLPRTVRAGFTSRRERLFVCEVPYKLSVPAPVRDLPTVVAANARGHWFLSRRTTLIDDAVCRRPIRR
jgi:hypothetical protein